MKKIFNMATVFFLCCSLCACNTESRNTPVTEENEEAHSDGQVSHYNTDNDLSGKRKEMKILNDSDHLASCYTNDGYYYLTEDTEELENGAYGTHLMYMDFATKQEIYLCSNAGCKHNTADCPAVFLMDEFPIISSGIFVYQDRLYVLSKEMDNEGAITQEQFNGMSDETPETETPRAALYEMKLDGTDRHKVFTFDAGLTVEDLVVGNDEGLYFVTKKLSNMIGEDNRNVTTSLDKKLVFWNQNAQRVVEICSLDFNDGITWKIVGCLNNALVLRGVDYGKDLTVDDYTMSDDEWTALYDNSSDVIAVLDLKTQSLNEKYRMKNAVEHSMAFMDHMLYVSYANAKEVRAINLESDEEKLLCSFSQNCIMDTFENTLCCRTWDLSSDYTYYFVNTQTGKIQNSTLVNQSLGWGLELKAEVGSQVLVVYDYEATSLGNDSYDVTQYKYALIDKEDLYAGNGSYHPIKMIGKGC